MAKTYSLQGPIMLEGLSNTDVLAFSAALINEVPAHSMGTAALHIKAIGPAGTQSRTISGTSTDELKASLAKAQSATTGPEDITYNLRGHVNLVGLSFAEGVDLIQTALEAVPEDSLVLTGFIALQESAD